MNLGDRFITILALSMIASCFQPTKLIGIGLALGVILSLTLWYIP